MDMTIDSVNTVNPVIDSKGPLKGKGASLAQWQAEVADRLEMLHLEMRDLAAESQGLQGRRFGLYLYSLRAGRQLRWRMKTSQHTTWQRIEPLLADESPGLAQWYRQAQTAAVILNHREQIIRYELKTVQRLMAAGAAVRTLVPRDPKTRVGRGAGGGRPRTRAAEGGQDQADAAALGAPARKG